MCDGWSDTALFGIIGLGLDNSFTEPEILGLINQTQLFEQVKV